MDSPSKPVARAAVGSPGAKAAKTTASLEMSLSRRSPLGWTPSQPSKTLASSARATHTLAAAACSHEPRARPASCRARCTARRHSSN
eukprot:645304-Alexandrium_andersonii.AAC.1